MSDDLERVLVEIPADGSRILADTVVLRAEGPGFTRDRAWGALSQLVCGQGVKAWGEGGRTWLRRVVGG